MSIKKQSSETFVFQPFEDLKRIIESKGIKMSCPPPASKKDGPANDEELFANAMREVREIKEFRSITVRPGKAIIAPAKISSDKEAMKILEEIIDGRRALNLADTQEYVEWINKDYRGGIIEKLHEGRFAVQDYLDLHGLCFVEAESAVEHFMKESFIKGHRCIKIIHGRGLRSPKGPVLKKALLKWLTGRYRKHIIAFVTARQCDGGLGALYILLR
jgi:DNA-nicking Smr family endonuclease